MFGRDGIIEPAVRLNAMLVSLRAVDEGKGGCLFLGKYDVAYAKAHEEVLSRSDGIGARKPSLPKTYHSLIKLRTATVEQHRLNWIQDALIL